jgi:hypothetical protein
MEEKCKFSHFSDAFMKIQNKLKYQTVRNTKPFSKLKVSYYSIKIKLKK